MALHACVGNHAVGADLSGIIIGIAAVIAMMEIGQVPRTRSSRPSPASGERGPDRSQRHLRWRREFGGGGKSAYPTDAEAILRIVVWFGAWLQR